MTNTNIDIFQVALLKKKKMVYLQKYQLNLLCISACGSVGNNKKLRKGLFFRCINSIASEQKNSFPYPYNQQHINFVSFLADPYCSSNLTLLNMYKMTTISKHFHFATLILYENITENFHCA